jgi:hypothetical protein
METKELRLVTHEQAERLKRLGFDWETRDMYWGNGDFGNNIGLFNHNQEGAYDDEGVVSAPAVALALKWIRDEKEIRCGIDVRASFEGGRINIFYCGKFAQYVSYGLAWTETNRKDSYPKAESALLDELLTVLEKEKEQ